MYNKLDLVSWLHDHAFKINSADLPVALTEDISPLMILATSVLQEPLNVTVENRTPCAPYDSYLSIATGSAAISSTSFLSSVTASMPVSIGVLEQEEIILGNMLSYGTIVCCIEGTTIGGRCG